MRPDGARIKEKRVIHLVAFGDQFAVGLGGVAVQKALVDCVVHHLNAVVGDGEYPCEFALRELRDCQHPSRFAERPPGQLKMQIAAQIRAIARPIHVIEQIVNGQHIRTGQAAGNPEQMRNMHHVALQAANDGAKLKASLEGVLAIGERDRVKICWQRTALVHFGGQADQEILTVAVQTSQGPDHVADISANTKFRHATDVDRDFHEGNLNTESAEGAVISP